MRIVRAAAVAMAVLWVLSSVARAQSFFSSSPGPLTSSHGALDDAAHCNDCHVNGTRDVANDKCLGCHDHGDLDTRIKAGKGFHVSALVKGKKCEVCHKEHKGRGYDLMGWAVIKGGEKGFDHDATGWSLQGKHAGTDCGECHKARNRQGLRTYMGTERLCGAAGCHGNDQPHKLDRKELLACERCHNESAWKPKKSLQFNHDDRRDAGMPLLGAHAGVPCTKCHVKAVFNLPAANPAACGNAGCHKSPHDGHLFGKRACDWCHSPTFRSFQEKTNADMPFFDHALRTRFELGAHKKLKCYACHTPKLGEARPVARCEQCHAKDDRHEGRFDAFGKPPRCNTCHPTAGWRQQIFDHARGTKFPLTAKHAEIACRTCHRGKGPADFERFAQSGCKECHAHRTVHAEPKHPQGRWASGQCLKCHARRGDMDDAVKQGTDGHEGRRAGCTGGGCHHPNAWTPLAPPGSPGRESVCR